MDKLMKKALQDLVRTQKMLPDLRLVQSVLDTKQSVVQDQSMIRMIAKDFVDNQGLLADLEVSNMIVNNFAIKPLLSDVNVRQELLESFPRVSTLLPDMSILQKMLEDISVVETSISEMNGIHLTNILECAALTHVSLGKLVGDSIGKAINIDDEMRIALNKDVLGFSDAYLHLCQFVDQSILDVAVLPTFAFELPTVEFFTNTDLLEAITVEELEDRYLEEKQSIRLEVSVQITSQLEELLAELDVNLIKMWRGAIQSISSNNDDSSRHFLFSLRELLTHVIHKLAPDEDIRAWTSSPQYFDKGKPTRKVRLLFICRDINIEPFSNFMEKDITAVLSCWEILNRAHEINIPFTQRQLNAFKVRVEGILRLLLEVWRSGK